MVDNKRDIAVVKSFQAVVKSSLAVVKGFVGRISNLPGFPIVWKASASSLRTFDVLLDDGMTLLSFVRIRIYCTYIRERF